MPVAFGREVRRRRQALGLTLEQLAERASLTPNYIGTVEHGQRDPSLSTIVALARGLGVSPGELLGSAADAPSLAQEAARLIEAQVPEVQEAMLELLRSMSKKRR